MPVSGGQHSYGCTLYYAALDTANPSAPPTGPTWTAVGEVRSINGVPMTATVTRLTNLASPNKAHEKIAGFTDGGQVSFKLNVSAATLAQIFARTQGTGSNRANSNQNYIIYLPSWGHLYFEAFLSGHPIDIPEDGEITSDATLEISGLPVLVVY